MSGIGELLRPLQEAVNLIPEALREGSKAAPSYTPLLAPKSGEAPWAIQDPAHGRAYEGEKSRQRRNDVETSYLNTRHLELAYLRYIVAGEIAGAWEKCGGLGALRYWISPLPRTWRLLADSSGRKVPRARTLLANAGASKSLKRGSSSLKELVYANA